MNTWREPTEADINGEGDFRYIIDIIPDVVPHQATTDGDALIRIRKPGWSWMILDVTKQPPEFIGDVGYEDDRWVAIAAAKDALSKLRS